MTLKVKQSVSEIGSWKYSRTSGKRPPKMSSLGGRLLEVVGLRELTPFWVKTEIVDVWRYNQLSRLSLPVSVVSRWLTAQFSFQHQHIRKQRREDFFQGSRFLTFDEFRSEFEIKTNFLNYCGLCHAVPQKWINILKGNFTEPLEKRSEKERISLDKLSCRSATKFFVKSKFVTPTAERRMTEADLKEHAIRLIYSLPFNVTKDTRLAIFQYKIIHHTLPTNSTLFRDSITEYDKCHLCGERQTLIHLFVTCSIKARLFWSLFQF